MLKNPPLLLDETLHRLATVQKTVRILVLDHGKLVEQGTHAELIDKGGVYERLAAMQFTT